MLHIVGLGPGSQELMVPAAVAAMEQAEVIVGYHTYLELITDYIEGKEVVATDMRGEVERCEAAIAIAKEGKRVAIVCSGDAGIYAMAGLVFELLAAKKDHLDVKIIPGITASIGGAALLGAPLMNDFVHISLSDLMTPWEMIERRLKAAAEADFVICLYNPRSMGRPKHLESALSMIRDYKGGHIPVGICKDIGRPNEQVIVTTIDELNEEDVDMTTTVIVGNKFTKIYDGRMYTPRGYQL